MNMNIDFIMEQNAKNASNQDAKPQETSPKPKAKFEKKFKSVQGAQIPKNVKGGQKRIYYETALTMTGEFDLGMLLERAIANGLKFTKSGDPIKNVRYYSCFLQKDGIIKAC